VERLARDRRSETRQPQQGKADQLSGLAAVLLGDRVRRPCRVCPPQRPVRACAQLRIGWELAGPRKFVLVNLAPTKLETDVSKLRSVITETPNRCLVTRTWSDALIGAPTEIRDYANARGAIR
jgi:hypothetical protein